MYIDTFLKNPYQIFFSILTRNHSYLIVNPMGSYGPFYTGIYDPSTNAETSELPELSVYRRPNYLTTILDKHIAIMDSPIPATLFARFGVWTALIIISMAKLILQRRCLWIIAYVPVLAHLATLFLTNGWSDYRYGLPVLFCGLFLPAVLSLLGPTSDGKAEEMARIQTNNIEGDS
jgi:hypothetical protein